MNQPDDRPVGGRRIDTPDLRTSETEQLLAGVEGDLASVDDKSAQDQVPVFDRIHTALADALARTADTGGSPTGGHQGA